MIEENLIIITHNENSNVNTIDTFSPPIDIYETIWGISIEIEIPGITKEDIKLTITGNKLHIKGEKRFKKEQAKQKYYMLERPYGTFNRIIELPENIDTENIKAKINDGVLSISIPYRVGKIKNVIIKEENNS
jgi:HSP20 family protein